MRTFTGELALAPFTNRRVSARQRSPRSGLPQNSRPPVDYERAGTVRLFMKNGSYVDVHAFEGRFFYVVFVRGSRGESVVGQRIELVFTQPGYTQYSFFARVERVGDGYERRNFYAELDARPPEPVVDALKEEIYP